MTKMTLMDIVNAAAARFDSRPRYHASIEARAVLAAFEAAQQSSEPEATTPAPPSSQKDT